MTDVTRTLVAIQQGDEHAADRLLPLVYDELRKLAAQKLSQEKAGQTLQATALVHEAYVRLVGTHDPGWNGRGHFFGAAAEAMRRILVDRARRKRRLRHGGEARRVELEGIDAADVGPPEDLLELDEALARLAEHDAVAARLVTLRFFAGLTMPQVAEALGIPLRTAERNWVYARTWLHREITRRAEKG